MLFTFEGETLDSDYLRFCPKQKAYVELLEDKIKALEFELKEQVRETREKILERK
jgi:hypothetical protein